MKTTTWSRDSHLLFDFESSHIIKKNLKTSSSTKIIRLKSDISLANTTASDSSGIEKNANTIAILEKEEGEYLIINSHNCDQSS